MTKLASRPGLVLPPRGDFDADHDGIGVFQRHPRIMHIARSGLEQVLPDDSTPERSLSRGRPGGKSACCAASEAGNPSAGTDGSPFELVAVPPAPAVRPAMSAATASAICGHDLCAGGFCDRIARAMGIADTVPGKTRQQISEAMNAKLHERLLPSRRQDGAGAKVSLRRRDCKHKAQPARGQSSYVDGSRLQGFLCLVWRPGRMRSYVRPFRAAHNGR